MKRFTFLRALAAGMVMAGSAAAPLRAAPADAKATAPKIAHHHMIVAAEPDAATAGLAMLRAGGSAVDAAIAAQMVLALEEPQASGVGGGSYIIVADGLHFSAYDGREMAPASARPGMFLDSQGKPRGHADVVPGGLSVGVPGTIAVLAMAHKEHGRLPWARLFAPAIKLADEGFTVPPRLAIELGEGGKALAAMPDIRANFFNPDGTSLHAGQTWRNPKLAQTLRTIAAKGPEGFYKGAIAADIAQAVTKAPVNPTIMTEADLAAYRAKKRAALCGSYRAYRICSLPPSTSGGTTVLQILGLLQRFPSKDLQPHTLSMVHLMSEAERLAYADRARWLGDTDFVTAPVKGLLDHAYLTERSALIDPMHAMAMAQAGTPPMKTGMLDFAPQHPQIEHGTSQIAVVDDRGEALSMTTSVEGPFGARIMADGFLLNNQLTDFSFEPEIDGRPVANAAAAGKRPLSAMSPVIVIGPDGKLFAALGSPGGRQIIGYVAQALVNLIDGHLSMEKAAAEPRNINMNGPTLIEQGSTLEGLAAGLTAMGHQIRLTPFDSGVNGIMQARNGGYTGGADPHREGVALGD